MGVFLCTIFSANRDSLTLSFPVCILLISFSCLVASASTLKGVRKVGSPVLFLICNRIALSFSPLKMMLAMGFVTYSLDLC